VDVLLFQGHPLSKVLKVCLQEQKLKGVGKGLATLLLYLSAPTEFNVWVPATERGLVALGRISKLRAKDPAADYDQFNEAAVDFRNRGKLQPQEMDWVLWKLQLLDSVSADDSRLAEDLHEIATREIDATTKAALVSARVGQGKFRTQVLQFWANRCAVTRSVTHDAVKASHIKPWRESTDDERLDPITACPWSRASTRCLMQV